MKKIVLIIILDFITMSVYPQPCKVESVLQGSAKLSGKTQAIKKGDVFNLSDKVIFTADSVLIICKTINNKYAFITNLREPEHNHWWNKIVRKIHEYVWTTSTHIPVAHMGEEPRNGDDLARYFFRFDTDSNAMLIVGRRKIQVDYASFKDTTKGYFEVRAADEEISEQLRPIIDSRRQVMFFEVSCAPLVSKRRDPFSYFTTDITLFYVDNRRKERNKLTTFKVVRVKSSDIQNITLIYGGGFEPSYRDQKNRKAQVSELLGFLNTFFGSIDQENVRSLLSKLDKKAVTAQ
ncbi:hypothetical protein [Mucilaginibacter sp. OK098]|uniref:hypothetical protein n=1 Tax=Mucilaginibacter sp. OK098 TaxID=1855297 RepID=UPI00091958E8|nr:hypothetical protein [Mucilaginibacter sp. OK098]SHM13943.1 hypothetical protein SAMN05216524_101940 [Mucilaginibacter sp. OK098]